MATLDQVEKLREKANVSYDEAKAALDAANGDLLEALIYLERQGKVHAPEGNGYYSSGRNEASEKEYQDARNEYQKTRKEYRKARREYRDYGGGDAGETFGGLLARFGRFLLKVIEKGNTNTLEITHHGETKASIPVTVVVLLLIFAFWVTLPLLVIGLFFGLRYRFEGPDLGRKSVNDAMDRAADATDGFKRSVQNSRDSENK